MNTNDVILAIIKEQSLLIGEQLAKARAEASGVIEFQSNDIRNIVVKGESKMALEGLINAYKEVFGQPSVNVCINVLKKFPQNTIDDIVTENIRQELDK